MRNMSILERYLGSLVGLAVGDALGTTLEFKRPGTFAPLTDMLGGGHFSLQAGQWTDDTSMALCLAESLVECHGFNAQDQMNRYVKWYQEGYLSSTGVCFDIGNATRSALERYLDSGNPFSGAESPNAAGNGSLMRLAPVPLYFVNNPELAMKYCADSSRTTHGTRECIDACKYFGGLIMGAVLGASKETILSPCYHPLTAYWQTERLAENIASIAKGSFKSKQPPQIKGSGYVVQSLEAALWAFYHSSSFAEGALLAVNLGDDADTTGAVYGQIAGAFYGIGNIPAQWRNKIWAYPTIETLARKLYEQAWQKSPQ